LNSNINQEEITEKVLNILRERGKKTLELTKKAVLEEKFESKDLQEALKYFMNEHWYDFSRPAFFSLCCESVGCKTDITRPFAISISILSGALALHDDIIDQSKIKNSKPTVLKKFGKNISLLIGDVLMVKGFSLLFKAFEKGVSAKQISIINEIIKKTLLELGDVEALQFQFEGRIDITPEDYLQLVRKKAADVDGYARISGMVGGGSEDEVEALGEFGRILGMLSILRNDMIDMFDWKKTTQRIKREHLPLTILYALHKPQTQSIMRALMKKTITKKNAEKLLMIVDKAGGFIQMEECMNKLAEEAYSKLEKINYNKEIFFLLIKSLLVPEWRNYLS
jgi:geranylgeranyl diphosphate synthase type I